MDDFHCKFKVLSFIYKYMEDGTFAQISYMAIIYMDDHSRKGCRIRMGRWQYSKE
jgi:hypothetical protein